MTSETQPGVATVFVTCACVQAPAPHLDGKHVVFGKVISGMDLLHSMERVGTRQGRPTVQVTIADSGELPVRR